MNFPVSKLSSTGSSLTALAEQIKNLAAEAESINASIAGSYDQGGVGGSVGVIAATMRAQASSLGRYGQAAEQAGSVYSNASAGLVLAAMQAGGFIVVRGSGKGSAVTGGAVSGGKPKTPREAAEAYTAGGGGFSKGGGGSGSFGGGGSGCSRGETDYSELNELQEAGLAMKRFEAEYDKLPEAVREGAEEAFGDTAVEAWNITSDILNNEVDIDTLDSALGAIGVDGTKANVITKTIDSVFNPDSIEKSLQWGMEYYMDEMPKQILNGDYSGAAKSFGMYTACWLERVGYGIVKVPVSIASDRIIDAGEKASSILDSLSDLFK